MIVVTDSNFEQEIKNSNDTIILDFHAPWCGPCNRMKPILENLDKNSDSKFKVATLNVDDEAEASLDYNITGLPTILILKNGVESKRFVGYTSEEQLLKAIEELA